MAQNDLLFPASIAIPEWLPDESLFSLLSRIHQLWACRYSWQTTRQLFGRRGIGYHHDFPGHLSALAQCLGMPASHALELASRKTLLSYYRLFLSAADERALASMMCDGHVAHLKMRLGILTSRFRANHPLKACPICIRQDIAEFGWAYWHLKHQYPGVWLCLDHHQPLLTSTLKSTGVERFAWHLPSESMLTQHDETMAARMVDHQQSIQSLAEYILDLQSCSDRIRLEPARLQQTYLRTLRMRGWISGAGSLKLSQIAQAFCDYAQTLRFVPELSALPRTEGEAQSQIGRLLRLPRTGTHPIRHFVIISWLYPNVGNFLDDYQNAGVPDTDATLHAVSGGRVKQDGRKAERERLRTLIADHNMSLRAAARCLGIDIGTAMMWAAKFGLAIHRRPKYLTQDIRSKIIARLKNGDAKHLLSTEFEVWVSTITRLLLTEPGLDLAWHEAQHNQRQSEARQRWLDHLASFPDLGTKLLRSLNPATYAWLYRNERAWLDQHLPAVRPVPQSASPRIKWDERDRELSTQVERIASLMAVGAGKTRRLYLWQLYQQLPELRAKLSCLKKLPLTAAVIQRVLGRSRQDEGTGNLFGLQ